MKQLRLTTLLLCAAVVPLKAQSFTPTGVPVPGAPAIPSSPPPLRIDLQGSSTNLGTNSAYRILSGSDTVEIPVGSVSPDEETSCHALTVVFDDNGDGGPTVEWIARSGERTLLSSGLGSVGTGSGIELRTMLLPQNLTLAGGVVSVSFTGRFSRLRVIELRPCEELSVAAPFGIDRPVLMTPSGHGLTQEEASGSEITVIHGDSTKGNIVRAELSATPLPIGEATPLEVVVPMAAGAGESFVKAEISGLDPAARVDVTVNGIPLGPLALESFPLDDPGTLRSSAGRLLRAGWRAGSLYVPAGLWKQGENSVVFSLNNAGVDTDAPVRLRNAIAEILFSTSHPVSQTNQSNNATNVSNITLSTPEPLSNGSTYGNPSPSLFHATLPTPLSPPISSTPSEPAPSVGP